MKRTLFLMLLTFPLFGFSQVTFDKHVFDNASGGLSGLYIADLNGDGLKDIVGSTLNQHKVYMYENTGDIRNWTRHTVDGNLASALYVFADDLDGDGLKEIICSAGNEVGNNIAWYKLNPEGGQWTKTYISADYKNAHGLSTADIDEDGDLDLVASSVTYNKVSWFENIHGTGDEWLEHIIAESFERPQSVSVGDFNNDGHVDVVAGSSGDKISWFRNPADNEGGWEENLMQSDFTTAHWVEADDYNHDGFMDICGLCYMTGEMYYWQNAGTNPARWSKYTISTDFLGALTITGDDLDLDGDTDFIATSWYYGEIAWWEDTDGQGHYVKHSICDYTRSWPVASDDLDNDGDIDIVGGSGTLNTCFLLENKSDHTAAHFIEKDIDFNIFPNPVNENSVIDLSGMPSGNWEIEVGSMHGASIAKQPLVLNENQNYRIPMTSFIHPERLKQGIYFCLLRQDGVIRKTLTFCK